jgi:hypothetical protein
VIIPFCEVEEIVEKTTLNTLPNALKIVTKDRQKSYFFTSFWGQYQSECYRIIKRLYLQVRR